MVTATQKLNEVDLAKLSLDFSETNKEMQLFLKQISSAYYPLGPKLSASVDEAKIAIGKVSLLGERQCPSHFQDSLNNLGSKYWRAPSWRN